MGRGISCYATRLSAFRDSLLHLIPMSTILGLFIVCTGQGTCSRAYIGPGFWPSRVPNGLERVYGRVSVLVPIRTIPIVGWIVIPNRVGMEGRILCAWRAIHIAWRAIHSTILCMCIGGLILSGPKILL